MQRAAKGVGVGGGLLGMIWGGLAPYLSYKKPADIKWADFATNLGGHTPEVSLIIGLVLGFLGIIGAVMATRSSGFGGFLMLACGVVGFILGPLWVIPGAMLLAAGGLAMAAGRR